MLVTEMTEITREKYQEFLAMGKDFSKYWGDGMSDAIKYGYGYYGAVPVKMDGKFFVKWERVDSCE